ncbi:1453_t:CDS:1, partial [Ambispora gerdemannii]
MKVDFCWFPADAIKRERNNEYDISQTAAKSPIRELSFRLAFYTYFTGLDSPLVEGIF